MSARQKIDWTTPRLHSRSSSPARPAQVATHQEKPTCGPGEVQPLICYDPVVVPTGGRGERLAAPEGQAPREPERVPAAGVIHLGHHLGERVFTPLPRIHEVEENDAMHRQDHPTPTAWIGIDVSKDTLDACFLPAEGKPCSQVFANDRSGHAALRAWPAASAAGVTRGFCLESTGAYGIALATALAEAGEHVSVVNPARVKYAGLMRGQGNKTDKADAKLIAEYATRERPPAWQLA